MAIRDDYRQFTVKYRRIILEKLRDPKLADEIAAPAVLGADRSEPAKSDDDAGDPAPAEAPLYCEIDIESAEKLPSGSLLFPLWKSNEEGGWCVMVKSDRNNIDLCDEYEIVGRIKNDIAGPEFMSLAYQYLLGRILDDKVLQSDWSVVESRRLTRRGVLKMFLESGDAGLRRRQFLLVPDPSPWLDQIESVLFEGGASPGFSH